MVSVNDVMKKLEKLNQDIEPILKTVGSYCDNVQYDSNNLEEQFLIDQMYNIINDLENVNSKMDYLLKPITAQGLIKHNQYKRYELPNGDYLTSGNVCELLVTYEDGQKWVYTSIEHNGEDYYATALGKETPIKGMVARIRR